MTLRSKHSLCGERIEPFCFDCLGSLSLNFLTVDEQVDNILRLYLKSSKVKQKWGEVRSAGLRLPLTPFMTFIHLGYIRCSRRAPKSAVENRALTPHP